MSTTQNLVGLAVFILAGGGLRLFLERLSKPPLSLESRFEIAALTAVAHRLVQGGMEIRAAASAVAASVANPATGLITEHDYQRLTYLIADGVYQLRTK